MEIAFERFYYAGDYRPCYCNTVGILHDVAMVQRYSYRADMPWWIFAVAAAGALLITLITVSYESIKAAMADPVRSLRTNE